MKFKVGDTIFAPSGYKIHTKQFCEQFHRFIITEANDEFYYLNVIEKPISYDTYDYKIGSSMYLQTEHIDKLFELVDPIQVTKLKSRFELIDI